jgi:hypothetical protein
MDAYGNTVDDPAIWTLSRAAAAVAVIAVIARVDAVILNKDM